MSYLSCTETCCRHVHLRCDASLPLKANTWSQFCAVVVANYNLNHWLVITNNSPLAPNCMNRISNTSFSFLQPRNFASRCCCFLLPNISTYVQYIDSVCVVTYSIANCLLNNSRLSERLPLFISHCTCLNRTHFTSLILYFLPDCLFSVLYRIVLYYIVFLLTALFHVHYLFDSQN